MNGQFNIGELSPIKYFLTVAIVIGLLFFFIGPDESSGNNYFLQAIQWQCQTIIPMFMAVGLHTMCARISTLDKLGSWPKLFLSGLFSALFFTPIALLLDVGLNGETLKPSVSHSLANEFLAIGPPIVICWLAINLPFQLGYRFNFINPSHSKEDNSASLETDAAIDSVVRAAVGAAVGEKVDSGLNDAALNKGIKNDSGFQSLLPNTIKEEIIYLKSELHYLKVVTVAGHALVLYSLKNAINELQHYDGVQCHRSFWVNRSHIESLNKNGREGILSMSNGARIPVSRARMKMLTLDS